MGPPVVTQHCVCLRPSRSYLWSMTFRLGQSLCRHTITTQNNQIKLDSIQSIRFDALSANCTFRCNAFGWICWCISWAIGLGRYACLPIRNYHDTFDMYCDCIASIVILQVLRFDITIYCDFCWLFNARPWEKVESYTSRDCISWGIFHIPYFRSIIAILGGLR